MTHPWPDRRRSHAQIWLQWAYAPCIHWIRCKVGLLSSCGHVAAGDPLLLLIWLFMDQVATSRPTQPSAEGPPRGSAQNIPRPVVSSANRAKCSYCYRMHVCPSRFRSYQPSFFGSDKQHVAWVTESRNNAICVNRGVAVCHSMLARQTVH